MNDPRAFLESYRYAFERFDLEDVLRHFAYPGLVVVDAGAVRQVPIVGKDWRGNVGGLFESYRKMGVRQIRIVKAECRELSPLLVLAEVEWSLRREDGSVIYDFHNLYVLGRVAGELKICSAVSPDESLKMRAALPTGP
jgi:hypothetical protein